MTINIFVMFKRGNSIPLFQLIFERHSIAVVCSSTDPATALQDFLACAIKPDIVFMDANWASKGVSGVGLTLLHQFLQYQVKVIVLTTHYDLRTLNFYKEHGAHGYAYRTSSEAEIITCIKVVHSGQLHFFSTPNVNE